MVSDPVPKDNFSISTYEKKRICYLPTEAKHLANSFQFHLLVVKFGLVATLSSVLHACSLRLQPFSCQSQRADSTGLSCRWFGTVFCIWERNLVLIQDESGTGLNCMLVKRYKNT